MSDAAERPKRTKVRRQRSIYQVHYNIEKRNDELMTKPLALQKGLEIQAYDLQVAGHRKTEDTKYSGLLQCSNGTILKPIIKESQRREVDFYERMWESSDPDLVELRKCTPKYFYCKKYTYNGYEQEYIILEDLTRRMLEPCIMDVKIGKRTWDPLATEEKIKNEQAKYALCKQQYGFCIPGFQVFKLNSGKLHKYNKEYGKKLHGQGVRDAIKNYLNAIGGELCRALLLQILSQLWRVQRWARAQTALRLYSASVLLVYDAARLRDCCADHDLLMTRKTCRSTPITRRQSIPSLHSGTSFSGQLSKTGPVYKKLSSVPLSPLQNEPPHPPLNSPWSEALEKLNHNHSFEHNYEDKLSKIKMNYRALLDQLSSDSPNPDPWGTVKIIDFAHAFFNEEEERCVDDNFKDGVDSFVAIFEDFLSETDDQII